MYKRQTQLVETLLNYARLDQHILKLSLNKSNLTQLVAECIVTKQTSDVEIRYRAPDNSSLIKMDHRYLSMLVHNLIQNAINYGNGLVCITIKSNLKGTELIVEDNGAGVPPELRKDILKPFVRGHTGSSTIKGHGIGLAIVKRIAQWHHATLEVTHSNEFNGAKFIVSFPK